MRDFVNLDARFPLKFSLCSDKRLIPKIRQGMDNNF